MLRGTYPDEESATRAAKSFPVQILNTYMVETGRVLPACPTIEEMNTLPAQYREEELNEIVGGITKRNADAASAFETHRQDLREKKGPTEEEMLKSIEVAEKELKEKEEYLEFLKNEYKTL